MCDSRQPLDGADSAPAERAYIESPDDARDGWPSVEPDVPEPGAVTRMRAALRVSAYRTARQSWLEAIRVKAPMIVRQHRWNAMERCARSLDIVPGTQL